MTIDLRSLGHVGLGSAMIEVRIRGLDGVLEIPGRIVILTCAVAVFAPSMTSRGWFDIDDEQGNRATIQIRDRYNFAKATTHSL